ncbi:helix-turn-helix domain-containing protein [Acetobacter sp. TBRC 12305]|uniref:Helix-turn-helix domain-containing protein n=1 Tax=Acetobacter garciniae TaxID=2817435 RepID=A0A939KM72_9PROT|nr:IclR family transcriptional regulator C-terminal domain-containing protein [Acetobacter garciniae]MBO1324235.1 helix-turn-helix domain-containing protein [Acetobacter garciniae]MBX0343924.1 helix-turn-helix domain-containing protein [Acetobacter garciniae]
MPDTPVQTIKSDEKPLERYFRILEVVSAFPSGIGLGQIADIVDLPKPTVHRLLRGLTESRLLDCHPTAPQLYVTGARMRRLLYTSAGADWVENVTRSVLADIAEQTGQTCYIARFDDLKIRSVAMVTPDNPSSGYVVPGRYLTIHSASSAKAILAFQDPALVRRILPYPLPRLTDKTITDVEDLFAQFAAIKNGAVAVCDGEDYQGFGGLACPVHLPEVGVIFSLALTGGVASVLGEKRADYEHILRIGAQRIAVALAAGAARQ